MSNIKGRPVAVDWVTNETDSAANEPANKSLKDLSNMQISENEDGTDTPNVASTVLLEDEENTKDSSVIENEETVITHRNDTSDDNRSEDDEAEIYREKTPQSAIGDAVKGTTLFLCNLALSTSRRQLCSIFKV